MAVFFLFLRNVLLPIEILKIKILEHSDPPSQHFSVHKAFSHSFFCRGKVVLCHPAEWHISESSERGNLLCICTKKFHRIDYPFFIVLKNIRFINFAGSTHANFRRTTKSQLLKWAVILLLIMAFQMRISLRGSRLHLFLNRFWTILRDSLDLGFKDRPRIK